MRLRRFMSLLFIINPFLQACGDDSPSTAPVEEWCDLERPRENCDAGNISIADGVEDARVLCETPCTQLGTVFIGQGDGEIFKALQGFRSASILRIHNAHPSVKDLSFLSEFEEVKILGIKNNRGLESVDGLEWLEKMTPPGCFDCGTSITIEGNPKLRSLKGLRNLKETTTLAIEGNESLADVGVFSKFELGTVKISNLPSLTTISGFESMRESESNITIRANPNLKKIDAWPNLTKIFSIVVERNRGLDECEVQRILDQLDEPPRLTMTDNGAACVR